MHPTSNILQVLTFENVSTNVKNFMEEQDCDLTEVIKRLTKEIMQPSYSADNLRNFKKNLHLASKTYSFSKSDSLFDFTLLAALQSTIKVWIHFKEFEVQVDSCSRLMDEGKYEEALSHAIDLPDFNNLREKILTSCANFFIREDDLSNAAIAIFYLHDGSKKTALIEKCPGYETMKPLSPPFTLESVLKILSRELPIGILQGQDAKELIEQKFEPLFNEWNESYDSESWKRLEIEVENEMRTIEGNDSSDRAIYIKFLNPIISLHTVLIKSEELIEEGQKMEGSIILLESPLIPQESKNYIVKELFSQLMELGDMASATRILSYFPDGEEKISLCFQHSFSRVKKVMGSMLSPDFPTNLTITEEMIVSDTNKVVERLDYYMQFSVEELAVFLKKSQDVMPKLFAHKETAENQLTRLCTADKILDEEVKQASIQNAINLKKMQKLSLSESEEESDSFEDQKNSGNQEACLLS